jgi:RNA polymerase sigma-70 factor (ECF subfamily)
MDPEALHSHLSQIQTHWTKVFQAHQGQGDARTAALKELLLRYYGAVYRYFLGMLRDPDAARELTQDFAVRFLQGDFQEADRERGRFRDFLKKAVRHMAIDHWRRQEKQKDEEPQPLPADGDEVAAREPVVADADQEFLQSWREELLARAWEELAQVEEKKPSQPYYTTLRYKMENRKVRSAELAKHLSAHLGRSFTENAVRQLLHRAREQFARLLVEEVARSLETDDPERLEQELIDLGLLAYCRGALRGRDGPA